MADDSLAGDSSWGIPRPLTFVSGREFSSWGFLAQSLWSAETRVGLHVKCTLWLADFNQNETA
jgi:hypothetical protein